MQLLRKSETLDKALALLTPKTWTKGAFRRYQPHQPYQQWCVIGAIREVLEREHMLEDQVTHDLYRSLVKTFRDQYPDLLMRAWLEQPFYNLTRYNDNPEMTYDGIRSVVEKTRNELQERGE